MVEKIEVMKFKMRDRFYVTVVPDKEQGENFKEFWLTRKGYATAYFMFGADVTDENISEMVEDRGECYIEMFIEEIGI